jgi:hypothetical protein
LDGKVWHGWSLEQKVVKHESCSPLHTVFVLCDCRSACTLESNKTL